MPIERPNHVQIGPHRFEIRWSAQEMLRHVRESQEDRLAQTEVPIQVITIDDQRPLSGLQESLLHEILHCLIWQANISVPERKKDSHHEREETLVGQLSGILLDCIQRNPHVFDWLDLKEPSNAAARARRVHGMDCGGGVLMPPRYEKVEDSMEAALGAGILAAILESSGFPWVIGVQADPDQAGAEAEMFVTMRGSLTNVILRLHVTEVKDNAAEKG